MLHITRNQFALLNQMGNDRFYADLDNYLKNGFPEYDKARRKDLSAECRTSCEELTITNQDGIYAFHVLSFMVGGSLQGSIDYQIAHRRYILLGHDADQLPIDLQSELNK